VGNSRKAGHGDAAGQTLMDMTTRSRGLRDAVVRGLARVGLVWALVVLGALFTAMSAQGLHHDSLAAVDPTDQHSSLSVGGAQAPRTAGLALALVILGGGLTVLAIGAGRGERLAEEDPAAGPQPLPDFARILGLLP